MNIYKVEVEFAFYVAARSEQEAAKIARENRLDALSNEPDTYYSPENIYSILHVPPEWRESLPYGHKEIKQQTISTWLETKKGQ